MIGFIAHVDTADFHAENIQPLVHENYDGNDRAERSAANRPIGNGIPQSEGLHQPNVDHHRWDNPGTGSDDKSGITEIVTAMETLIQNPTIPHGEIRIAFGPDEEIGTGADRFDAEGFNAAFAYTLDSGRVGHMEYEPSTLPKPN